MESNPHPFQEVLTQYIHRSKMIYNTGLKKNNLIIFVYIPLDIFREIPHNKFTELEAWLYFPGLDNPQDILHITQNTSSTDSSTRKDLRGDKQSDTKCEPKVGYSKLLLGLVLQPDQRRISICAQSHELSSGQQN